MITIRQALADAGLPVNPPSCPVLIPREKRFWRQHGSRRREHVCPVCQHPVIGDKIDGRPPRCLHCVAIANERKRTA